jgi:hypothetical protein
MVLHWWTNGGLPLSSTLSSTLSIPGGWRRILPRLNALARLAARTLHAQHSVMPSALRLNTMAAASQDFMRGAFPQGHMHVASRSRAQLERAQTRGAARADPPPSLRV